MTSIMTRYVRPKIVRDVRRPGHAGLSFLHPRVNLSYHGGTDFFVPWGIKFAVSFLALIMFFGGSVAAPNAQTTGTGVAPVSQAERQALEAQLKELEVQIDQYESEAENYRKQGSTLKNEIGRLNSQIAKINLKIKSVKLTLTGLDKQIGETKTQIVTTEEQIGDSKTTLANLIREIHVSDEKDLIEIFLERPRISDFFLDVSNNEAIQKNVRAELATIVELKNKLEEKKTQLAIQRADTETARAYQDAQRKEAESTKRTKDSLLSQTKGKESEYQALVVKTKETATQIRSRLFELLGGGELTFEQAYQYAKLAGDTTGIRPAFILAILHRESALGQNVGRCKYNEVSSLTGKSVMHPTRDTPAFLDITKSLGIDPTSITVSCPNKDGTYGGAMGPAQFIPSTWKLYAAKVTGVTGRNPASPWNNADAFVAAALYLKDVGGAKNERTAAAKYYCGGNWNRYVCTNVYGQRVVEQAAAFEDDIRTISG